MEATRQSPLISLVMLVAARGGMQQADVLGQSGREHLAAVQLSRSTQSSHLSSSPRQTVATDAARRGRPKPNKPEEFVEVTHAWARG